MIYTSPQVLMQTNDSLSTRQQRKYVTYIDIDIDIYIDMSQKSQASMTEVLYSSTIGSHLCYSKSLHQIWNVNGLTFTYVCVYAMR